MTKNKNTDGNLTFFSFLISSLLITSSAFSQEKCTSGTAGQNNLIDQLKKAKTDSPVSRVIFEQYDLNKSKTEAECSDCHGVAPLKTDVTEQIERIKKTITTTASLPKAPQFIFKPECLTESNQFQADTEEVSCPSGQRSKSRNLCVTEKFLNYQNAVISSFANCLEQEDIKSLAPETLFKLYSLESGFKPQFSYNKGVGLGQLTGIFVDDIHQAHRGRHFLKTIADSKKPECAAAKFIAEKDLKQKPSLANTCSFISVGEGLERNALYTLVGMANSWKKDIEPKLKSYLAKYADDPKLKEATELALLNSYGPGGRVAARAAISRLDHLTPDEFIKAMAKPLRTKKGRNLTVYTNRIEARQKQILNELSEPIKAEFAKSGANACIN